MSKPIRIKIEGLSLNSTSAAVAGILIAKSDVRLFSRSSSASRSFGDGGASTSTHRKNRADDVGHTRDSTTQRGVITFTVRDAQHSFINCVIWGSDSFVESYNLLFHIGDAVNVLRPSVTIRKNAEEFTPMCSSPYSLSINEGTNEIVALQDAVGIEEMGQFVRLPIKATSSALQLIDISACNGSGGFVDLLVAVREMRPIKMLRTQQSGRDSHELASVIVMDRSSPGVTLKIWNQAYVKRSKSWHRMSTVLQLIDVRVAYSNFSKSVEISTHGRTLIIENPKSRESSALSSYVSSVPQSDLQPTDTLGGTMVDVSSIKTVMTIKQISDKIESEHSDEEFTAVLYALIERFDLDGFAKIFTRRCTKCNGIMNNTMESCQNDDCVILQYNATSVSAATYVDAYDVAIDLADHTGSLKFCRIGSVLAEHMLGCTLERFRTKSMRQRGEIKWNWLLERCTLKMVVKRKTVVRTRPLITIVDCEIANGREVLANIKMY